VDPILSESRQELHILLVEDDPGDVLMTQEAFVHHKITNPLHVVTDGVAAMEFLRGRGRYADAPRPGLILLDLNLPKMDGREVLAEIKSDDNLRSIPVVVLTTSSAEEDILRSYNTYANAYVTKPVDLLRFMDVVRQIEDFFITVVQHPR
jgi:CheY-like chemotaxis protein